MVARSLPHLEGGRGERDEGSLELGGLVQGVGNTVDWEIFTRYCWLYIMLWLSGAVVDQTFTQGGVDMRARLFADCQCVKLMFLFAC